MKVDHSETNETIVLCDVLIALLRNNVAILVIDDAHHMSSESWRILINIAKRQMDTLIVLTLLIRQALQDDKEYKSGRLGLKAFSETDQEMTLLEMAHTAGRSMAKKMLLLESDLEVCQDEYDELKANCIFTTVGTEKRDEVNDSNRNEIVDHDSKCHLHELELRPLSRSGLVELIKAATTAEHDISSGTINTVMDITRGNPVLIWKLIRYFYDSDYSNFDKAIGQLCDNSLIVSLIENLSNVQKSVLKYCATIGAEFSINILLYVYQQRENCLARQQLLDIISDLMSSGLIVRMSEEYYRFKTPLIRKFIYALVPPSVAAIMHHDIAAHIRHRYSDDPSVYSSLSYHYTNSSNTGTNAIDAFTFSFKTAEKYLMERRLLEIIPFLETSAKFVKCRDEVRTCTCTTENFFYYH